MSLRQHARTKGPVPATAAPRWNDLDALRGFAMLLGIALHASLSFFPGFWVVLDTTADKGGWFDEFFHAIHGFRMPLFFLLSGFFTAMLWRRRGTNRLARHRIRRIALPLAIGLVTVVPLTNWSIERAIDAGVSDYIAENEDIWAAVFFGNEGAVEKLLDRGVDVNAQNFAEGGDTPLHVAAVTGDAGMAELLRDRGADLNFVAGGGRPIDYAVFFGNAEVADMLVTAGADDPRPAGADWTDIDLWAEGAGEAEQLEAELGLDSWLASLYHLWFLWFLLWLVAGFVLLSLCIEHFAPVRSAPGSWSGWMMWALIPLTLVPQSLMGDGGDLRVFGPDTSIGWIPVWHVLAYYAVFFGFGALLYGRPHRRGGLLSERIGHRWPVLLPLTVATFAVALHLTFETDASWAVVSISQTAYAWLAIIALMGLARSLLATERSGVRYLSDSAYWLYLAHLPLVILAQTWIRNWHLPAAVKFFGLTIGVTVLLLISYQLFVRYTPIGTLLNGRRTRPTTAAHRPTPATIQEQKEHS